MAKIVDIADVVARVMRDHGLTQQDIASAADVTTKTVSRWLDGAKPPVRKVARALEQLGIDPTDYGMPPVATVRVESTLPPAWFQRFLDNDWRAAQQQEQTATALERIWDRVQDTPDIVTRLDMLADDLHAIRVHLGIERKPS